MNTYFQQSSVLVQSQEFVNDLKATVRFIFTVIKLLFLLIVGLVTFVKGFYCRQPHQITGLMETNHEYTDLVANEILIPVTDNVEALNVEVDNNKSTLGDSNIISYEGRNSNNLEQNNVEQDQTDRKKQLKSMKATELRKLCADFSINYQNKQQAVTAILEFESPDDGIPF